MNVFRVLVTALDVLIRPSRYYETRLATPLADQPPPAPDAHLVCGVPDCRDGVVASTEGKWTLVHCEPHGAVTRHESVLRPPGEQKVIRVQDQWRQHGVSRPPK